MMIIYRTACVCYTGTMQQWSDVDYWVCTVLKSLYCACSCLAYIWPRFIFLSFEFNYRVTCMTFFLQCCDTCWFGDGTSIRPVRSWVLVCWWWRFDWSVARLITTSVILSSKIKLVNPCLPCLKWGELIVWHSLWLKEVRLCYYQWCILDVT